ncbi:MAG: alanyl-tRNA synthetase [Bdellovibrio sp. ArHS]|uniref:alanine--tRNA ligase n=1 Tax=Bdellovibrio sp. ArHS TaxID=1569284 RepID=UPI0005831264|nr:alanine--tRNA ligase [Bdellovibrio sp. ArHS]KHD89668.1 MAG: alanyl-tRNA synthetase [Bdellovibrio sp. ArHS]
MKSSEIRNAFVEYFKKKGHTHVGSSSLIPENDPTLLFANAGMNQFKNTFLGLEKRDYSRAVTVQKCVRAGGKHNDLENVGFTARHHTFFEMLGNFSFGDYFKKDAIHFAWEFLTKELNIPKEKLYVTVHISDDEAAEIWHKQEGIPQDRIFRFDADNFWKMGDTGPCGPCTEIFYDHGPKAGTIADPYKGIAAGEDRFVEIWNLVFMQYFENPPGTLTPLPKPSVDTGSGLERVVAAMQGKFNNYDTDLFMPMIERACKIGNLEYITDKEVLAKDKMALEKTSALRVLADHCRSTSFLIADGALPSNEGRGYVLRRIMRRAIRYGRKLSADQSFLPAMAEALIESMSAVYPELSARRDHILNTIRDEEDRFISTLDNGTNILMDEIAKAKNQGAKELSGEVVFRMYDTYGFPADLTRVIANEQGIEVNEAAFEKEMEANRAKSKASWKGKALGADEQHLIKFAKDYVATGKAVKFTGYADFAGGGSITALSNGQEVVTSLKEGDHGVIITDETSFYGEGGGQVGDIGYIMDKKGSRAKVVNTTKTDDIVLHHVEVEHGEFKLGQAVDTIVNPFERRNTMSNHSATHLLHSALRKVLGSHVTQAGSLVDSQKTRFDFTHNKPLSSEEIRQIEDLVNEQIAMANDVKVEVMSPKEAQAKGAMALFGEKYGDKVRVLTMGDFSCELCGGTHVQNTAQIRLFKIVSEAGVSAGVRRVEAITGDGAVRYAMNAVAHLDEALSAAGFQKSPHYLKHLEATGETATLAHRVETLKEQIKFMEKEMKKLQGGQVNVDDLAAKALTFKTKAGASAKLVLADLALDDRQVLAEVTDHLKNKIQNGVVVVVGQGEGSNPIIVSVSKEITTETKAGDLLKEVAAIMGGKGGGRPDFAQGAAPNRGNISQAFDKVKSLLGV